jgi:hypothetical protein
VTSTAYPLYFSGVLLTTTILEKQRRRTLRVRSKTVSPPDAQEGFVGTSHPAVAAPARITPAHAGAEPGRVLTHELIRGDGGARTGADEAEVAGE